MTKEQREEMTAVEWMKSRRKQAIAERKKVIAKIKMLQGGVSRMSRSHVLERSAQLLAETAGVVAMQCNVPFFPGKSSDDPATKAYYELLALSRALRKMKRRK